MYSYPSVYPPDDYYTNPVVFWNRDYPPPMISIKDQKDTGACTAFAMTNIMYFHIWTTMKGLRVELSAQQLYDHFSLCRNGERPPGGKGISLGAAALYISRCGLLMASEYPWRGGPTQKFVMPTVLPVHVTRAEFKFIKESEFEEQLLSSPIAAGFSVDEKYNAWVLSGSPDVFPYTGDVIETSFHHVTIVGYGRHSNGPQYYIIQDSNGVNLNMGFKKIERSFFKTGIIVKESDGKIITSYHDEDYKVLTHSV